MFFTITMICIMPFIVCTAIVTNMCLFILTLVYFPWFSQKTLIFRFVGTGFPFATISTAATLTNSVWCHYIIFLANCTTNFIAIQVFFWQTSLIIHVTPRAAFIIYIYKDTYFSSIYAKSFSLF